MNSRLYILFLLISSNIISPLSLLGQKNGVSYFQDQINKASTESARLDSIYKYAGEIYNYGEFELANNWAEKGSKLALKFNDTYKYDFFQVLIGRYLARVDKITDAIKLVNTVKNRKGKYFLKENDLIYRTLSRMYEQSNNMDSSLYYILLADSIYQKQYPAIRYQSLLALSDIYAKQGLQKESIAAAERSIQLFTNLQDTVNHLWLLYRISETMYKFGDLEKYSHYAQQYIELSKTRKSKFHRGIFDMDVSTAKHVADLEKVIEFYRNTGYERGYFLALQKQISLLIELGENRKAYDALLTLEPDIRQNNFENSTLELLETKYNLERKLGMQSQALNTVDELIALRDSFQKISFARQSLELETKHKTKEKEQEILILSKENEVKDLYLQRSNMTKWLLGLGSLALLLFSFYLYKNVQSKKKVNKILEEKNEIIHKNLDEKETLLKEIHHRVKNNLQIISSLLRLQSRTVQDPDTKEVLLEGQNRVQSMALIHQNLYKEDNLTGVEVKKYVEKLSSNLLETYNISEHAVRLKLDIAPINLDVSTLIPLGLIINELFTNSLKYAFKGRNDALLGLSLYIMNDILYLHVYDNGNGLSEEIINFLNDNNASSRNKTWGFGTRLLKTFSKKLDAKVIATNENGTRVEFQIRNYTIT